MDIDQTKYRKFDLGLLRDGKVDLIGTFEMKVYDDFHMGIRQCLVEGGPFMVDYQETAFIIPAAVLSSSIILFTHRK